MAKAALVLKLTAGEREELRELLKNGVLPVRTVIRALALLRMDAAQTQRVIALACGPPPPGQARWSVRLLAAEVRKRKLVPGVGREVIRIALQDHDLKPWREKNVVRANS